MNEDGWPDNDASVDDLVNVVVKSGVMSKTNTARLVADGMQHVVVIINENLVARFARDSTAAESLQREADLLTDIKDGLTVPIPVPVYLEATFTVHQMLHGAPTTRGAIEKLSAQTRRRLADEVATLLDELQALPVSGIEPSVATTSPERLDQLRERVDRFVVPLLWRHQRDWCDELFAAVETVSFEHRPSVIHGDLAPYHLLHDPSTGHLTGLLDFGVAGVGDPAVDLGCLLVTWGETHVADIIHGRPTTGDVVDRARFLALTLPLDWSAAALEHDAADMAVAHLGNVALDIKAPGSPLPDHRS